MEAENTELLEEIRMKKRILSCVLALVLLLTLLPTAAAATEADTTDTEEALLYWENVNKNGDGWTAVDETQIHQGLFLPTYGDPYLLYQRIWIKSNEIRSRVTSVTSQNGCYEITQYKDGENSSDHIFQFTAKKTGSDILTFSIAGNENALRYSVEVQLPDNAFYSSGTASTDTFLGGSYQRALDVTCASAERTLWLLTKDPLYALSSITLDLDGQALTPDRSTVDGVLTYEYTIDGQKLLRAEWLSRADGKGNGLKLTILSDASSIVLPAAGRRLSISVTARSSEDEESSTSLSSGTLRLRPDYRINYCYVNSKDNKYVANTATIYNDLRFNITSKEQSTLLAFYYRDPETDALTPISYDNITITPSDGVTISKMSGQDDHILLFSGWKLGTYTISCNVGDNTYSQPLSIVMPTRGLFTAPTYSPETLVAGSRYEWDGSSNIPALWLLQQGGYPSGYTLTKVQIEDAVLSLDESGYAALNGVEKAARFQFVKLSEDSDEYGVKIEFLDKAALDALIPAKAYQGLYFDVYFQRENQQEFVGGGFSICRTDPPTPEVTTGKYFNQTDPSADGQITPYDQLNVSYNGKNYSIVMGYEVGGQFYQFNSSYGYTFREQESQFAMDVTLSVETSDMRPESAEAKKLLSKLVSDYSFRVTDDSYTAETGGFLTWNDLDDPIYPTAEDPRHHFYLCVSPRAGTGRLTSVIELKEGVTVTTDNAVSETNESKNLYKITTEIKSTIPTVTTIDCVKENLTTMDALNTYLNGYEYPNGNENRLEIKLAPVAYEGTLNFIGNHPETGKEPAYVAIHGTSDGSQHTTIYGNIVVSGPLNRIENLYIKAPENASQTVGLTLAEGGSLFSAIDTIFDGFSVGLDCNQYGYVRAIGCVFKNCTTGARISCAETAGTNTSPEWTQNTFFNCTTGLELTALPPKLQPYHLRFEENNFLNNTTDIAVPDSFDQTYYFYRNFFGALSSGTALTAENLRAEEKTCYRNSIVRAPVDHLIVSPRLKYPLWTALYNKDYHPADLLNSGSGETDTGDISTQALFAAPMRAAAFSATNAANTSVLTIETSGQTTIQNENASSLVIDDPDALKYNASIQVVTRKDDETVLLGTWEFTENSGKVNGGFNAGLDNYSAGSDRISFEVTGSPALSTLNHTLSIPVPTGWSAATVTGPDGKAQHIPLNVGGNVTCSVTKGGQYTIAKADPVWAYDPAITGTTFTARLDMMNFGNSLSSNHVIFAAYGTNGRMLTCQVLNGNKNELKNNMISVALSNSILTQAKTFRLFNLGGSRQPLNRSIQWDASSITKK